LAILLLMAAAPAAAHAQTSQSPTESDNASETSGEGDNEAAAPLVQFDVGKLFPEHLHQTRFLLPDYKWICIAVVILLGLIADLIARLILHQVTAASFRLLKRDRTVEKARWRPAGLLAQAIVWYVGTEAIGLPDQASLILLIGLKFFTVVAAVWTGFHLIDVLVGFLRQKAEGTATKFDDLLVPLVSKTLKLFAICVGVLSCAEALNLPLTGLLGGLGIGGAAIAFASKDAISNIFGSVTVLVDRPFEIGDWIVSEDVEGTVEAVGFRSTRVRTFYDSLITLPNSRLTTAAVDNMGRRRYRRITATLGVSYNTTMEQMDAFCEGVRELIRRHPYTRKDYFHVYFNAFGDSALQVMLYCFVECPDWSIELREKHRLYADILKLAETLSIDFAFPTQTLLMHQAPDLPPASPVPSPLDAGRQSAAEIAGPLLTGDDRPGAVEF
jgi:MscS family membrane protein